MQGPKIIFFCYYPLLFISMFHSFMVQILNILRLMKHVHPNIFINRVNSLYLIF